MHEQPLPFITLPNWVKAASLCGFNIQPVFDELGIETDLIHLEHATISRPLLEQVMIQCVARARSQHFPFVLGETFAFDYLPDIGVFLATSPTLRDATRVFEWVRTLINPMIDVRLEEQDVVARLVLQQVDGGSSGMAAVYFIESIFAAVVKFARMLHDDIEHQSLLQFRYPQPPHVAAYAEFFRAPVVFLRPRNAVELPRALLDRPLGGGFPALHGQAEARVEQRLAQMPRRTGLVAAVESAFEHEPRLLGQGIERLAERLGLHPRTLQRRLRDEGEAFGELLDRIRYRLALRDLDDPRLDLEAISERLGFSDRRSFTRAFSRWAGVTPSGYRKGRD
ncbi:helix-turn-helix transcriptional regulator [Solimonas marina]|nr:AraC family transcriptional regulator [Solimonas marina]